LPRPSIAVIERRRRRGSRVNITDTFTRADSALSLGVADTGQSYTLPNGGTFGISSNQGYNPSAQGDKMAVIESGAADCTVSIAIVTLGAASGAGVYFRVVDGNNWWRFVYDGANYTLRKIVAGIGADVFVGGGALAANDVLSVILSGTSIIAKRNSTTITSQTDAALASATMHGWGTGGVGSAATRWDLLSIAA
jgi:hypothetical protein